VREAATICPHPCDLDLWPFDLESGVRITCDAVYLCANFSLPMPLGSRLSPEVRDRQTSDVRRASSLNAPPTGRGIIILGCSTSVEDKVTSRKLDFWVCFIYGQGFWKSFWWNSITFPGWIYIAFETWKNCLISDLIPSTIRNVY